MKKVRKRRMLFLFSSLLFFISILAIIMILTVFFPNREKKLNEELNRIGQDYYSQYWYPSQTKDRDSADVEIILSKYKTNGVKVNLDSLINIFRTKKDITDLFINKKVTCDKAKTYILFYPKEPYESNDVKIDTFLECGF